MFTELAMRLSFRNSTIKFSMHYLGKLPSLFVALSFTRMISEIIIIEQSLRRAHGSSPKWRNLLYQPYAAPSSRWRMEMPYATRPSIANTATKHTLYIRAVCEKFFNFIKVAPTHPPKAIFLMHKYFSLQPVISHCKVFSLYDTYVSHMLSSFSYANLSKLGVALSTPREML